MKQVIPCELPPNSCLSGHFDQIYYQDAYQVRLRRPDQSISEIYNGVFGHSPVWVNRLMKIRNQLVAPLGLKVDLNPRLGSASDQIKVGNQLGIFQVFYIDDREIILGEDNRHLDFHISLLKDNQGRLTISTQVQTHNRLGRVYMQLVRPFHCYLVHYVIRGALKSERI